MKAAMPLQSLLAVTAGALFHVSCTTPQSGPEGGGISQGTRVATTTVEGGANTQPAYDVAGDPEGVARIGGQLYYVKDRRATLITREQRFGSGLVVGRNGEVLLPDGRRSRLRAGEMVTLSGELREAPPGVELPRPAGQ